MTQQPTNQLPQERTGLQEGSLTPNWEIPTLKHLPYDKVMKEVTALEDLRITPDRTSKRGRGIDKDTDDPGYDCMALSRLKFTAAGTIQVPGFGLLTTTKWAERQLGSIVGVKFGKFFENQDPDKINRALQDHFRARGETPVMKIVARRHIGSSTGSDGVLRGIVGRRYTMVKDSTFVDRLRHNLGPGHLDDMVFTTMDLRDNGSHFVIVDRTPTNLFDMKDSVRNLNPHRDAQWNPPSDVGYYGLRIRNSEVGAYSFTGDGYAVRLVCINGMLVAVDGERIVSRVHRGLDMETLDELINDMFRSIPRIRETVVNSNKKLRKINIDDPEEEIRNFLGRKKQPNFIQDAAVKAYFEEPQDNAFGILQAITRLGMAIRDVPDRQFEIEGLANEYQKHVLKKAS